MVPGDLGHYAHGAWLVPWGPADRRRHLRCRAERRCGCCSGRWCRRRSCSVKRDTQTTRTFRAILGLFTPPSPNPRREGSDGASAWPRDVDLVLIGERLTRKHGAGTGEFGKGRAWGEVKPDLLRLLHPFALLFSSSAPSSLLQPSSLPLHEIRRLWKRGGPADGSTKRKWEGEGEEEDGRADNGARDETSEETREPRTIAVFAGTRVKDRGKGDPASSG